MRSDIKGYENYRYGKIATKHHYQSKGGLRDLLNMHSTADAPYLFSELYKTYPGIMTRDKKHWTTVRLATKKEINKMREKYGPKMEKYFSDVVGY